MIPLRERSKTALPTRPSSTRSGLRRRRASWIDVPARPRRSFATSGHRAVKLERLDAEIAADGRRGPPSATPVAGPRARTVPSWAAARLHLPLLARPPSCLISLPTICRPRSSATNPSPTRPPPAPLRGSDGPTRRPHGPQGAPVDPRRRPHLPARPVDPRRAGGVEPAGRDRLVVAGRARRRAVLVLCLTWVLQRLLIHDEHGGRPSLPLVASTQLVGNAVATAAPFGGAAGTAAQVRALSKRGVDPRRSPPPASSPSRCCRSRRSVRWPSSGRSWCCSASRCRPRSRRPRCSGAGPCC